MVVDLIAKMKAQSKTGATGFGQLNIWEGRVLQNAAAQLQQSQTEQAFRNALREIRQATESVRNRAVVGGPAPSHDVESTGNEQEFDWINGQLVPRK